MTSRQATFNPLLIPLEYRQEFADGLTPGAALDVAWRLAADRAYTVHERAPTDAETAASLRIAAHAVIAIRRDA